MFSQLHEWFPNEELADIQNTLRWCGISGKYLLAPFHVLSAGQQHRVQLAYLLLKYIRSFLVPRCLTAYILFLSFSFLSSFFLSFFFSIANLSNPPKRPICVLEFGANIDLVCNCVF